MPISKRGRLHVIGLVIGLLALVVPLGVAQAASPHTVDPDSLSPALNPHYAPYDCWAAGGGAICQGDVQESYGPFVMDWFDCDGQTIYISGRERQHITRWHDADGNATSTILDTEIVDVFSLDPDITDPSVTMRSRFTKHYDYPVPGDRDSRVMRQTGASLIAKASEGGVIARETGWIEYEPGLEDEVIADYRGQKDLVEDFDGFVAGVCTALGAG
jgi:hypothetical protein